MARCARRPPHHPGPASRPRRGRRCASRSRSHPVIGAPPPHRGPLRGPPNARSPTTTGGGSLRSLTPGYSRRRLRRQNSVPHRKPAQRTLTPRTPPQNPKYNHGFGPRTPEHAPWQHGCGMVAAGARALPQRRRKVRARQDTMVGNAHPHASSGCGRGTVPQKTRPPMARAKARVQARVKRRGKSPPPGRRRPGHGKPHRVQGQTVSAARASARAGAPSGRQEAGRPLDRVGNGAAREMAAQAHRPLGPRPRQTGPAGTGRWTELGLQIHTHPEAGLGIKPRGPLHFCAGPSPPTSSRCSQYLRRSRRRNLTATHAARRAARDSCPPACRRHTPTPPRPGAASPTAPRAGATKTARPADAP